jgi:hypothetical protein
MEIELSPETSKCFNTLNGVASYKTVNVQYEYGMERNKECPLVVQAGGGGFLWTQPRTLGLHEIRTNFFSSWVTISFSRTQFHGVDILSPMVSTRSNYGWKVVSVVVVSAKARNRAFIERLQQAARKHNWETDTRDDGSPYLPNIECSPSHCMLYFLRTLWSTFYICTATILYCHDLLVVWFTKTWVGLETGFASLTTTTIYNKSPTVITASITLHPSGTGLPFNLPASVADARSLGFNWLLFGLDRSLWPLVSLEVTLELSASTQSTTDVPRRRHLLLKFLFLSACAISRIYAPTSRLTTRFHIPCPG